MSNKFFSNEREMIIACVKTFFVVAGVMIPFFILMGMFSLDIMGRGIRTVYVILLLFIYATVLILLKDGGKHKTSGVLFLSGIVSLMPTLHGMFLEIRPWPVSVGFIWFCLAMGIILGAAVFRKKDVQSKLLILGGEIFFIFLGATATVSEWFHDALLEDVFLSIASAGAILLLVIFIKKVYQRISQKRNR